MDAKALAAQVAAAQGGLTVNVEMTADEQKGVTGSTDPHFNHKLLNDAMRSVPSSALTSANEDPQKAGRIIAKSTVEAMRAFAPTDAIEGMIAAQVVALHNGAMECLRRANTGRNSPEVNSRLRRDGANLARAMTDMVAALDRKRGKAQQRVEVQHVHVHKGGQAVVGDVTTGVLPPSQQVATAALGFLEPFDVAGGSRGED